jgi:hypothetical protein
MAYRGLVGNIKGPVSEAASCAHDDAVAGPVVVVVDGGVDVDVDVFSSSR